MTEDNPTILRLEVLSAHGLKKKDIFGASDPYGVIYLSNIPSDEHQGEYELTKVARTTTLKKTLDPVWSEAFDIEIVNGANAVVVELFDENRLTRDDFLGRVGVRLSDVETAEGAVVGHPLLKRTHRSNVSGTLLLRYELNQSLDEEARRRNSAAGEEPGFSVFLDDDVHRRESTKYQFISIVQKYQLWPQLGFIAPFLSPASILSSLLVQGDQFLLGDNDLTIPYSSITQQSLHPTLLKQVLLWLFNTSHVSKFNIGSKRYRTILAEMCSEDQNVPMILATTGRSAEELMKMNVRVIMRSSQDIEDYPEYPRIVSFSNTILVDFYDRDKEKRKSLSSWLGLVNSGEFLNSAEEATEDQQNEIYAWYHQIVRSFRLETEILTVTGSQRALSIGDRIDISEGIVQLPIKQSMKELEKEILTNLFDDQTVKNSSSFDLTSAFIGLLMTDQQVCYGLVSGLGLELSQLMSYTVRESIALGQSSVPAVKAIARTKTLLIPADIDGPQRLSAFLLEWIAYIGETQSGREHASEPSSPGSPLTSLDMFGRQLPDGWELRVDTNGRTFYLNHETRTTQWVRPEFGTQSSSDSGETQFQTRRNISSEDQGQWEGDAQLLEPSSPEFVYENESVDWFDPPADEDVTPPSAPDHVEDNLEDDNSLPSGWEMKQTAGGRIFFVNHVEKVTTWVDPRTGEASPYPKIKIPRVPSRDEDTVFRPLPGGWEEKTTKSGKVYFVDHNTMKTTWNDPRLISLNSEKLVPYSRNYKTKYDDFIRELKKLPSPIGNQKLLIKVKRSAVLADSFLAIMTVKSLDILRSKIWITFEGEAGLDYGGVSREWFSLVSKEVFNPYYGLFEYSASDNYTLQINPNSGLCTDNHLEYFKFIGRVAGMAAFHKRLLDGFFIRPFYKMMLRAPVLLKDMEYVDIEYYNSLLWIKNNDPECLDLTFDCETEVFGEKFSRELKPGGMNIQVTEENKLEYISLVINWRFNSRIKPQMTKFLEGFNDVIPLKNLQIFDSGELELLLSGVGVIDVADWRANTQYKSGYSDEHQVIGWFWNLILTFGDEMRSRLLQFVTGTSRVPMNGFKELQGSDGPRLFTIELLGGPDSLPRAHTCFNRIDLPQYRSFVELRDKVVMAVEGSAGFDLE